MTTTFLWAPRNGPESSANFSSSPDLSSEAEWHHLVVITSNLLLVRSARKLVIRKTFTLASMNTIPARPKVMAEARFHRNETLSSSISSHRRWIFSNIKSFSHFPSERVDEHHENWEAGRCDTLNNKRAKQKSEKFSSSKSFGSCSFRQRRSEVGRRRGGRKSYFLIKTLRFERFREVEDN